MNICYFVLDGLLLTTEKGEYKFASFMDEQKMCRLYEKFILEYWDNNQWKKASEGTTIGYKRLLEFPSITASKVRLRIISSRLQPTLAEMGLYFDKSDKK